MESFQLFKCNKHSKGMKELGNNKDNNVWCSPVEKWRWKEHLYNHVCEIVDNISH